MRNIFKKNQSWMISGFLIFPIIILLGAVLSLLSAGQVNFLFWLILPSIVFEQLFETWAYGLSNSQLANFLFGLLFWFVIGAGTGWLTEKFKR